MKRAMARAQPDNPVKDTAPPRAPADVLVVEDDTILAMSIEDALRDGGAKQVTVCHTTQAALEALRNRKPDAIVLDVHLADRDDGWAIAELVGQIGPNPPRIVFSTGAPQDIPADIAAMGAVLTKPYAAEDLLDALAPAKPRGLLGRFKK